MKKNLYMVLYALLLSLLSVHANAQTDYEYRMEIGGGVGLRGRLQWQHST